MTATLKLAFYKGYGHWTDRLIRWWTKGSYSHCEILLDVPSGLCLGASQWDGGVRTKYIRLSPHNWDILDIDWVDIKATITFAKAQIGKEYDWKGIFFSQILPISRHSSDRWFCSELVAESLGFKQANRYSPNHLFHLLTDINLIHEEKQNHG